jgi:hypothetical protein
MGAILHDTTCQRCGGNVGERQGLGATSESLGEKGGDDHKNLLVSIRMFLYMVCRRYCSVNGGVCPQRYCGEVSLCLKGDP